MSTNSEPIEVPFRYRMIDLRLSAWRASRAFAHLGETAAIAACRECDSGGWRLDSGSGRPRGVPFRRCTHGQVAS